jgi:cytochrome c oxidase subunit II
MGRRKSRARSGRSTRARRGGGSNRHRKSRKGGRRVGTWVFGGLVAVAAIGLFAAPYFRGSGSDEAETVVKISMSGFQPSVIRGRVGQPIRVKMVNLDNRFHTDGGGWHNLVIEDLNVAEKVAPKRTRDFTIQVDQPGVYAFYCDICCGGKENPFMQGRLIIT